MNEPETCTFCKKLTNEPLTLLCTHSLCMKCAISNKILINSQFNQPKFHITCKICKKTTQTYDLDNLRTMVNELIVSQESDQQLTTLSSPKRSDISGPPHSNTNPLLNENIQPNRNTHNTYFKNLEATDKSAKKKQIQKQNHRRCPSYNVPSMQVKQMQLNQSIDENKNTQSRCQLKENQENIQQQQQQLYNTNKIGHSKSYFNFFNQKPLVQVNNNQFFESYSQYKKKDTTPQTFEEASIKSYKGKHSQQNFIQCQSHGQEMEFFCGDCGILLCLQCCSYCEHRNHDVKALEEAGDLIKLHNQASKQQFKETQKMLLDVIDQIQNQKQLIQFQREKQLEHVKNEISELIELFRKREHELTKKITTLYDKVISQFDQKLNTFCTLSNDIIELNENNIISDNHNLEQQIYFSYACSLLKTNINQTNLQKDYNLKEFNEILLDTTQKQQIKSEIQNYPKVSYTTNKVANFSSGIINSQHTLKSPQNTQRQLLNEDDIFLQPFQKDSINNNNIQSQQQQQHSKTTTKHRRTKSALIRDNNNDQDEEEVTKERFSDYKQKIHEISNSTNNTSLVAAPLPSEREATPTNKSKQKIIHFKGILSKYTQVDLLQNFFSESQILQEKFRTQHFLKLLPENIKSTKLLYTMQQNGASSSVFHQNCDNRGPYIILVKTYTDNIFGYFMPVSFIKEERYVKCDKAWIFSFVQQGKVNPLKFMIKPDKQFIALYQSEKSPCLGSTLSNRQDLFIDFDLPEKSCSKIGYAYQLPDTIDGTNILNGNQNKWKIQEIEVFQLLFQNNYSKH